MTLRKVRVGLSGFKLRKFIFWPQHFTAVINEPERNRLKVWAMSPETQIVSFVGDERKPYTSLAPLRPNPAVKEPRDLSIRKNARRKFTGQLWPTFWDHLLAKLPCLYNILIISSTNVIRTRVINNFLVLFHPSLSLTKCLSKYPVDSDFKTNLQYVVQADFQSNLTISYPAYQCHTSAFDLHNSLNSKFLINWQFILIKRLTYIINHHP